MILKQKKCFILKKVHLKHNMKMGSVFHSRFPGTWIGMGLGFPLDEGMAQNAQDPITGMGGTITFYSYSLKFWNC